MALLFCDGFEVQFSDDTAGIWDSVTNNTPAAGRKLEYTATNARTGDGNLRIYNITNTNEVFLSQALSSAISEFYIGFGFYHDAASQSLGGRTNNAVPIMTLLDSGGSSQLTLVINDSTTFLEVYRGSHDGGTKILTGSTAISSQTQYYIELHGVIDNSSGEVEIRVGTQSDGTFNGDTQATGNANIQTIHLGLYDAGAPPNVGTIDAYYDDFVIVDTSGSVANSWPFGAGVERLDPDGDGNYSQWTSTGGNDYTEINDLATYGNAVDDDTTRIYHGVVGERTSVTVDNTSLAGDDVLGVAIVSYAKGGGADDVAHFVRLSTTDYDQTAFTPASGYGWHMTILTTNPATTSAWATSEIDGMEIGWKVA